MLEKGKKQKTTKTAPYPEIRFVERTARMMYQKINHRETCTVAGRRRYILYYQHHNPLSISIHVRRTIACVHLPWLSSLVVLREISTAYMSNTLPVMLIHRRFLALLERHRISCNTRDSLAQFPDKRDRKLI